MDNEIIAYIEARDNGMVLKRGIDGDFKIYREPTSYAVQQFLNSKKVIGIEMNNDLSYVIDVEALYNTILNGCFYTITNGTKFFCHRLLSNILCIPLSLVEEGIEDVRKVIGKDKAEELLLFMKCYGGM